MPGQMARASPAACRTRPPRAGPRGRACRQSTARKADSIVRPTRASARGRAPRPEQRAATPSTPDERSRGTRRSVDDRQRAAARGEIHAAGPRRSRRVRGHGLPAARVGRPSTQRRRLALPLRVARLAAPPRARPARRGGAATRNDTDAAPRSAFCHPRSIHARLARRRASSPAAPPRSRLYKRPSACAP